MKPFKGLGQRKRVWQTRVDGDTEVYTETLMCLRGEEFLGPGSIIIELNQMRVIEGNQADSEIYIEYSPNKWVKHDHLVSRCGTMAVYRMAEEGQFVAVRDEDVKKECFTAYLSNGKKVSLSADEIIWVPVMTMQKPYSQKQKCFFKDGSHWRAGKEKDIRVRSYPDRRVVFGSHFEDIEHEDESEEKAMERRRESIRLKEKDKQKQAIEYKGRQPTTNDIRYLKHKYEERHMPLKTPPLVRKRKQSDEEMEDEEEEEEDEKAQALEEEELEQKRKRIALTQKPVVASTPPSTPKAVAPLTVAPTLKAVVAPKPVAKPTSKMTKDEKMNKYQTQIKELEDSGKTDKKTKTHLRVLRHRLEKL